MSQSLFLIVAVLGCYATIRLTRLANWYTLTATFRFFAMWLAATAIGYGTPLYTLAVLLLVALLWSSQRRRLAVQIVIELATLGLLIWHSQTPLIGAYLAGLVLFDQVFSRVLLTRYDPSRTVRTGPHRILTVLLGVLAILALSYLCQPDLVRYLRQHEPIEIAKFTPLGIPQAWLYQRELPTGVYWESRFPTDGSTCALLFHGAAAEGSLQSTARSIMISLLQAKIRVFAIDHPGFGESPVPRDVANLEAWDPALHSDVVVKQLDYVGCETKLVIGHSQGTTEALRLLTTENDRFDGFLIMGAGLFDVDEPNDRYWFERFHTDRRMPQMLEFDQWRTIRDLYYLNQDYCADSDIGRFRLGSVPLHYLVFDDEHENLIATREKLWDCLNYPPGEWIEFNSGHYLDSAQVGPFAFVSTPQIRALTEILKHLSGSADVAAQPPDS